MHITKIELEDIKSHVNSTFEFERGTTAIVGQNGVGKTTIIETVGWTLFDLLDYKKDDFVKRGAKKGVARVTFQSNLDDRRYLVHRDTKTAYYVYDPKLKTRIADKKEEVTRFLWTHLGVEVGTDLESLFRRAIGVPQGTFTAIFLESATERKRAFDKLLKVEEYRQSSDKLRDTAKYLDGKIITVREKIARAEGELKRFDELEENYKNVKVEAGKLKASTKKLEVSVSEKRKTLERFQRIEDKVKGIKASLEKLKSEKSRLEFVVSQKEIEKSKAEEAAEIVSKFEEDYQSHAKSLGMIKELERERGERQKLNAEMAKIEAAIVNVKAEQKSATEDRKRVVEAHREIENLKPKLGEQEKLEKQREELRNEISDAKSASMRLVDVGQKLESLRERYRENQSLKKEAKKHSAEAKLLKERQMQDETQRKELAGLRANLERDQKFQSEIENGLCPVLSSKCLNLKEGQTLDEFVTTKFGEVKSEIARLENDQKELSARLNASREAEKQVAKLETIKTREEEIAKDGVALREEKEKLEVHTGKTKAISEALEKLEANLAKLNNPKARIQILERETTREISLREASTKIESNLERLESDRRFKVEQLEAYKDLDSNWKEYTELRDKTADSHREYIKNELRAKSVKEKKKELEETKAQLAKTDSELTEIEKNFQKESDGLDIDKYESIRQEFASVEKEFYEAKLNFEHSAKRQIELEKEITRLKEVRETLASGLKEKDRLEKISDVTAFIRNTLKEAAPRVARNYVHHVSIEANQMFREISGNAERTLKWADDYGILLEEDGHERPFQNLSGGEQMAAAMSVRLALLKQLSDIRLAFFDEPTMNMDAERRERLAEQISKITERQTFDQLFVISHDDTFEGYVDSVVNVRNEDAAQAQDLF